MQNLACILHTLEGSSQLLLLHCELNDQPWFGDWPNSGIVALPGLDSRAALPYKYTLLLLWPFESEKEIIAPSPDDL